jgi:hypothetical protein
MDCVDRSVIGEERRLMEEIEPQMTKIFKEFTGGSKVWLTTGFFKKVYREMYLAQQVIVGLYEANADLNESLRLAAEANKDLQAKVDRWRFGLEAVLEERAEDRAEVAREIFEEIEKTVNDCVVDDSLFKPAYFEFRKFNEHLAELKKKYTGESQ